MSRTSTPNTYTSQGDADVEVGVSDDLSANGGLVTIAQVISPATIVDITVSAPATANNQIPNNTYVPFTYSVGNTLMQVRPYVVCGLYLAIATVGMVGLTAGVRAGAVAAGASTTVPGVDVAVGGALWLAGGWSLLGLQDTIKTHEPNECLVVQ